MIFEYTIYNAAMCPIRTVRAGQCSAEGPILVFITDYKLELLYHLPAGYSVKLTEVGDESDAVADRS